MEETANQDIIFWFFLALFLLSIMLLGWLIWPFISIMILAAVVTGVFKPLFQFLNRRLSANLASTLTCGLIFIVLFVPIVAFVGILSNEATNLYLTARTIVSSDQLKALLAKTHIFDRINLLLGRFDLAITYDTLTGAITELAKAVGLLLIKQANLIAANILSFLVNFFFMLLVTYFLLIDGDRLITFITDLSPLPDDQDEKLIQKFKYMAGAVLIGNGLGGLIQGALGGAVFALFGLQSPFLWGLIMGLLAFLPILGIGMVFIPAAGYLFLKQRIAAGVFFIVFYLLLSGGVEYLLKPKLVGNRVQMHTLLVFLSIIGGLKLFGILGIIYGPLVVTAFLTLTDIYHTNYQKRVESVGPYP